jgi:SWI/SNF chromatin-remodeling complex subunit SWI1
VEKPRSVLRGRPLSSSGQGYQPVQTLGFRFSEWRGPYRAIYFTLSLFAPLNLALQVSSNNGWGAIIAQFNLPEEIPQEPPNVGTTSVAQTIAQYYMALLYPFEQYYKSNIQEQQKRALANSRQPGAQGPQPPTTPNRPVQAVPAGILPAQMVRGATNNLQGPMNSAPGVALNGGSQMPSAHNTPLQQSVPITTQLTNAGVPYNNTEDLLEELKANGSDGNVLDQEMQGIKRKMEDEERDGKRTRQKIGKSSISVISS